MVPGSNGKVRLGVIGVGNIAQHAIMPAFLKLPDVEIVAVCDINEDRAHQVANKLNVPHVYTDFNEMVQLQDIDCINICTWNNAHAAATIAALEAGKDVLCEKPMAMTVAEAEAMRDTAKRVNRILMIGLVQRYRPEVTVLKCMADAGKFGDVYFGKATVLRRRGTPFGWFTDPVKSGGGPVIDLGVHVIDATRYLMGSPQPVRVSASTYKKFGDYRIKGVERWVAADGNNAAFEVEDLAGGVIHFDNGATMLFDVSWAANAKQIGFSSQIFGTKAGASVDPLEVYGEDAGYLVDEIPVVNKSGNKFELEVKHFIQCVKNRTTPVSNADEALATQKILNAIYESARLGKEVTI